LHSQGPHWKNRLKSGSLPEAIQERIIPRYFFHIRDGEELLDDHGTVLASREDARAHAIIVAGELLRDAGRKDWGGTEWRLRVTDEMGRCVCTLRFLAEDGSAD
jgi:hypothetical protein